VKTRIPLLFTLALALLGGGCVGTGPNTQQGAVAGGALGALAGAIIGNNSRSHNALAGAAIGATAGAIAGGTLGNAVDQQNGTIYTSEVAATSNVIVQAPPPPPPAPTELVVAQPAPDAVWISGCWVYEPRGYAWMPGHWERPPPNYRHYMAPHWQRREGGYVFIRGYWH
jgi:hypothetical protein